MDIINETLARVRAGVDEALAESGSKRDDLVDELAEAVADLDEALCTGMSLPKPWARWWQRAVTVPTPEQRATLRTDAERHAQPEDLPQGVYREGPDL